MIYFRPHHFKASDGSHIPVLTAMLRHTTGPILELGTGFYSTPILHWLCAPTKRKLVSCESHPSYHAVALNYATDWHKITKIEDWYMFPLEEQYWSLALVDHGPGPQRKFELKRLVNHADYVIVHDTEPQSDRHYRFSEIAPLYRYRWDFIKTYPHTSVFSNRHNLSCLEAWVCGS